MQGQRMNELDEIRERLTALEDQVFAVFRGMRDEFAKMERALSEAPTLIPTDGEAPGRCR
jgi:hypothetical protein